MVCSPVSSRSRAPCYWVSPAGAIRSAPSRDDCACWPSTSPNGCGRSPTRWRRRGPRRLRRLGDVEHGLCRGTAGPGRTAPADDVGGGVTGLLLRRAAPRPSPCPSSSGAPGTSSARSRGFGHRCSWSRRTGSCGSPGGRARGHRHPRPRRPKYHPEFASRGYSPTPSVDGGRGTRGPSGDRPPHRRPDIHLPTSESSE